MPSSVGFAIIVLAVGAETPALCSHASGMSLSGLTITQSTNHHYTSTILYDTHFLVA